VNKYLHTVASVGFLFTLKFDIHYDMLLVTRNRKDRITDQAKHRTITSRIKVQNNLELQVRFIISNKL